MFVTRMLAISPPLGFSGLTLPPAPPEDCRGNYGDGAVIRSPAVKGLRIAWWYMNRNVPSAFKDRASADDSLRIGFRSSNQSLSYLSILHKEFPKVILAFSGYRAFVAFKFHAIHYQEGGEHNPRDADGRVLQLNVAYNQLLLDKNMDINGRNCIFTLEPAMFWDGLLCRRALGYGPEEVIRRLDGKVPVVQPLMDGVYIVFNDDINLTYAQFVEMNERNKALLGLI
jgi:hypothetical protein